MHKHLRNSLIGLILGVSAGAGATEPRQILVGVNGLVCAFCAHGIQRALSKEAATDKVDVDLEAGRVTIALKPDGDISDARLRQLLTDAGYTVTQIDRDSTGDTHD